MSTLSYKSEFQSAAANALVDQLSLERHCIGCNCSDNDPCVAEETGRTCSWVPDHEMDICSFCAAIAIAMADADERDAGTGYGLEPPQLVELATEHEADLFIRERRKALL